MKKIVMGLLAILLGLIIGLGSLRYILTSVSGEVHNGPWTTDLTTGGSQAGAYTRAKLAIQALLAMTKDQAVYFIAETDSNGQPLDASCHYTLSGGDLPTRWWSITMYANDYFFVPNSDKRYAISKSSLTSQTNQDGQWTATIANSNTNKQSTTNLISPVSGPFSLIVRLYNPDPIVTENPNSLSLPVIEQGECK